MEMSKTNPAYELTKQILAILEQGTPYRALLREFRQTENEGVVVDVLELDYEIAGLCQYPFYKINRAEALSIHIQEGHLPQIYLREDFPIVPHLIVSRDGKQRHICYTDLPYVEIKHKINGRFIVECINNWFVKTARNELHRDDQPLEPFFWWANDVIILNPLEIDDHFAKFTELHHNETLILKQVPNDCNDLGAKFYVVIKLVLPPSSDNIIHYPPTSLRELLRCFEPWQLYSHFRNELKSILTIRQNQRKFLQFFNSSTASLLNCPCIITLNIPQKRNRTDVVEHSDYRVFLTEAKSFGAVLSDFGIERERLRGKQAKKGSVGNKLVDTGKMNLESNIGIRQFNLHWANIQYFSRIYNDIETDYNHLYYALIGCGALGSQLFANCIRSGFGKWTLVDKDIMFPHNLARHILTLDSIGQPKAPALERYGKSILEDTEVSSIIADVMDSPNEAFCKMLAATDVIIDVSTSVAVERMLALDIVSEARRISLFLNPCGKHLVMLCEDAERKVTLDQLEMQLYSILANKDKYVEYFNLPSTIAYTTSCRDITSKISQDNLALCAAVASKELKLLQTSKSASLVIWTINDDGIIADRYGGEIWYFVSCGDWQVEIRDLLLRLLQTKRAERQPNETGGVLIGQYDFSRKKIYIVDMIFSPDDSIEAPTSYIRGCKELPKRIQQIAVRTYNNFSYIGEWHSHPGSSTAMSRADELLLGTISDVNKAEGLPGCMIICGDNSNFSVYIWDEERLLSSTFALTDE
jgi:proteasome lid subunit RPN8/RPN11